VSASEDTARRLLTPHLWDGEQLLWCDLPQTGSAVAAASARKGFYATVAAVSSLAIFFVYFSFSMFDNRDRVGSILMLAAGAVVIGSIIAFRTVAAWVRGRFGVRGLAYGVSNRRILVVHGTDLDWVGPRQLEEVVVRGHDVVVTRRLTDIESLWTPQTSRLADDDTPGGYLLERADVAAHRELTLVALRDPLHVMDLVQTLQHPTAS
jgi:hypothetical protein